MSLIRRRVLLLLLSPRQMTAMSIFKTMVWSLLLKQLQPANAPRPTPATEFLSIFPVQQLMPDNRTIHIITIMINEQQNRLLAFKIIISIAISNWSKNGRKPDCPVSFHVSLFFTQGITTSYYVVGSSTTSSLSSSSSSSMYFLHKTNAVHILPEARR